jgi:hypothetical protein
VVLTKGGDRSVRFFKFDCKMAGVVVDTQVRIEP